VDANADRKEELHSFLYGVLLEKIISGDLGPGQRLVEEDLARTYGVSRTPIREVLLAFEKDGLVERVRNRGAKVVSFTADDVEELFDIRKALETHCIPNVVRTIKLNELLELEHRLEALADQHSPQWRDEHARIDLKLHHLIVENSGNRRLIAEMKRLSMLLESLQLASFRADLHLRETGEQHLAIIRALLRRDVDLARRLLAEHIEHGKRNALELFLGAPREPGPARERPF
jgi:GntR family transcriptional regulator, rspAB operon transcriptional repressor